MWWCCPCLVMSVLPTQTSGGCSPGGFPCYTSYVVQFRRVPEGLEHVACAVLMLSAGCFQ